MAAGLGFKDFTTGEVLTAADVDGYLMQNIWVFATATARDAAVTSPQEGNFAFTKDNNSLWYYDGAAWVASGATGDIEGVTAGIGISGGGTSGTVTVTNSMATAIDAKGDLIAGTGADTFAKLTVGANGTTLVADSSEATGLKWAAASGGGKVLQVVSATYGTEVNNSTSTFATTNLTATITPSSASSKVLVLVAQSGVLKLGATQGEIRLVRDSTTILNFGTLLGFTDSGAYNGIGTANVNYLDSPATTSAITYKTEFKSVGNVAYVRVQAENVTSQIVLMEIGA